MKIPANPKALGSLLLQAELLIEAGQLRDALVLYDGIITHDHPDSHLLQRRGWLRRLTDNLDGAIADYDRAIMLSPDDADLYCNRGACLAHRMSNLPDIGKSEKSACLAEIIKNYHASIERDPSNPSAWLALVEAYLLQHDWDAAIAHYALCRPYIKSKDYLLVRAWLGCLAMCLAGDSLEEEDFSLLQDNSIKMHHTSWCVAEIDSLLAELAHDSPDIDKQVCSMKLHRQFLSHFIELPIRANAFT